MLASCTDSLLGDVTVLVPREAVGWGDRKGENKAGFVLVYESREGKASPSLNKSVQ